MLRQIIAVSGALSLALLLPVTASAHGAWVAERWGNLGVVYGHGAGDDPYDPARITQELPFAQLAHQLVTQHQHDPALAAPR